jgi:hypothetical protein
MLGRGARFQRPAAGSAAIIVDRDREPVGVADNAVLVDLARDDVRPVGEDLRGHPDMDGVPVRAEQLAALSVDRVDEVIDEPGREGHRFLLALKRSSASSTVRSPSQGGASGASPPRVLTR